MTLTPPSPHGAFTPLTWSDGSSIYDHKGKTLFTSTRILDAEDQLLDAARTRTVSPISRDTFERTAATHTGPLDAGQRDLAREFATSDRELVVGIGPAGAGKTTALRLAATALEDGGRRMIGLAPSAPAASVIAEAVGIEATTIHGFLTAHAQAELPTKYEIHAGDVLVVDEAGMAGTQRLAALHTIAREYGAHVRLIGDDRQLSAVEAGGALRLIDREVGSVRLEHVHRFQDADEAEASLHLRDPLRPGDPFAWYQANDRVIGGDVDRMTDAVFAGWQADTDAGLRSLMLAPTGATVTELNARAQAHRIAAGTRSVKLRDDLSSAIRGQNLLIASSAIAVALTLITPPVYAALDALAPFPNFVDLVSKLALFAGLLLAGTQVARAWEAPGTQRWVSGRPGLLVFVAVIVLEVVLFAFARQGAHAPDLADQLFDPTSRAYSTVATAYPAYIAALLLPHLRAVVLDEPDGARDLHVPVRRIRPRHRAARFRARHSRRAGRVLRRPGGEWARCCVRGPGHGHGVLLAHPPEAPSRSGPELSSDGRVRSQPLRS
ncbi:AAA family ATPase [Clavibacter michiganensis]|uniref:AAA family ATPase n=1 Tax=Clavibacter michiganensis TaxID=28447 RepID=UPI00280BB027|nr:AAA family ATPase [Clavibacter michiganensis]